MKVFIAGKDAGGLTHLLVSSGWEQPAAMNSLQFDQLMVLRAQFFCEDVGRLHYKNEAFSIVAYNRDKHLKKLCPACVLKAKRSKKHGPVVTSG